MPPSRLQRMQRAGGVEPRVGAKGAEHAVLVFALRQKECHLHSITEELLLVYIKLYPVSWNLLLETWQNLLYTESVEEKTV